MTLCPTRRLLTAMAVLSMLSFAVASPVGGQFFQRDPGQPDRTIDAATRAAVLEATLREVRSGYVFPDKAAAMDAAIRRHQAAGDYDALSSARVFADSLSSHLRAVAHDKHLAVLYSYDLVPEPPAEDAPHPEQAREEERMARKRNFGFERVERLAGNVGYLEIRQFAPEELAGPVIAAALSFLSNTDALIVDLRRNGGGDGVTVAHLCSYFLPPGERRLLNTVIIPRDDARIPSWSLPEVPGPRYEGRPIYILTGPGTFSAAEEFAYNMQSMKRAIIVGTASGGGAHPVRPARLDSHFMLSLPFARSENPQTLTNWEGVGVKPDVETPEEAALPKAHRVAIEELIARATTAREREPLEHALRHLDAGPEPGRMPEGGARRVIVRDGR